MEAFAEPPWGEFRAFYEEEYASAVRLAYLLTGSRSECEDIAQDAFARIHHRYDLLDNPAAYLRTTIVNAARTRHRARGRAARRAHLLVVPANHVIEPAALEVLDVLDGLPWRYKAVLVLRYWGDASEAEIAEACSDAVSAR